MAKFVYRMQNILDIKYKLENQAKIAYSQANAALREEEKKLAALLEQKRGYELHARELVEGRIDLTELGISKKAIETMKVLIRNEMLAVHTAEQNAELARAHLEQLMVERKTQEKLREKAFDEFKQQLAEEDNKVVDELVSYTYGREEQ